MPKLDHKFVLKDIFHFQSLRLIKKKAQGDGGKNMFTVNRFEFTAA